MRILLISFLFGFTYLFPLSLFPQSTNSNTSTIPIYTSKLFERQLIQYAYDGSPNPKTGVFSGVVTNYNLDSQWGFADFRLNTFSAPKPAIYSFIILSTSELIDNPIFPKNFSDDLMNIWIKFSHTYQKDKYEKIFITDKSQYSKLLDSLDKKLTPYYSYIDSIGVNVLDNIQSRYTSVTLSKTQIVRNTKVSKLEANKFWETSFSLFDAYDDKLITLESPSNPVYNLFIFNETDNIDSLINLRHSDIENGYSEGYRNWSFSPNKLATNNGIKFKNIDNFLKWAKVKYPEKFVNTQVTKSQTLTNTEQSKNVQKDDKSKTMWERYQESKKNISKEESLKYAKEFLGNKCPACWGSGKMVLGGTDFPHKVCSGKGCRTCKWTGKVFEALKVKCQGCGGTGSMVDFNRVFKKKFEEDKLTKRRISNDCIIKDENGNIVKGVSSNYYVTNLHRLFNDKDELLGTLEFEYDHLRKAGIPSSLYTSVGKGIGEYIGSSYSSDNKYVSSNSKKLYITNGDNQCFYLAFAILVDGTK